jgi:hypothetical protein
MPHTRTTLGVLLSALVSTTTLVAQTATYPSDRVLTHREQAPLVKGWIEKRFDTVLPALMRREKIDMWIIVSREYNDDPVFRSMAPLTTYSSRRRTILVFNDRGGAVDRLSIGRFDYNGLFTVVPTANDEQWSGVRSLVEERDPRVIGVNTSEAWNHADGLTANEKEQLLKALGPKYSSRVRSAEMLAVGWLETKIPEETDAYRHVMKVAHQVIAEAFSNKVIQPSTTRRSCTARGQSPAGSDDEVRDDRSDGQCRAGRGARAGQSRGADTLHLLSPGRLSWACGRSADRHDRLSERRACPRRLRLPARHVAFDRTERPAPGAGVGQSERHVRARRGRRADTEGLGLDRRAADAVLSD